MTFIVIYFEGMRMTFFFAGFPALIATVVAASIRYKQFQQLIDAIHPEEFEQLTTETI